MRIARDKARPQEFLRGARPARDTAAQASADPALGGAWRAAIITVTLLGAALLVAAEFTTLFTVRVTTSAAPPIKTVSAGAHHSYALIPIGVLAAVLAYGGIRHASRPALLAVGALGVVALLIALLGDLPDARATGLVGSNIAHYQDAGSTPSAGLYLETLGAILLILGSGAALLMLASSRPQPHLSAS